MVKGFWLARYVFVVVTCSSICGCASHAPEPTPHPSTPHISWSIAEGESETDLCKSTETSPCVLSLGDKSDRRRLAVFHLFMHAANTDTRYAGTVRVGFITEEAQPVHQIDGEVKRGSDPMNFSVTGLAKPPGTYYVEISIAATAAGSNKPVQIADRIRVDVK